MEALWCLALRLDRVDPSIGGDQGRQLFQTLLCKQYQGEWVSSVLAVQVSNELDW